MTDPAREIPQEARIRELVAKWRASEQKEYGYLSDWHGGIARGLKNCADELEHVLGAPPATLKRFCTFCKLWTSDPNKCPGCGYDFGDSLRGAPPASPPPPDLEARIAGCCEMIKLNAEWEVPGYTSIALHEVLAVLEGRASFPAPDSPAPAAAPVSVSPQPPEETK
jgi:hypothetical protein